MQWNKKRKLKLYGIGLMMASLSLIPLMNDKQPNVNISQPINVKQSDVDENTTTALKPNTGSLEFSLRKIQQNPVQIFPTNFNYTFQEGRLSYISSEIWTKDIQRTERPYYYWFLIDEQGNETEIKPANGEKPEQAKILSFIPDHSYNEVQIKLQVRFQESETSPATKVYDSDKMTIWTSTNEQKPGVEFDPFGVRKLFESLDSSVNQYSYGIYAQQLTESEIYSKILTPINMKYFYDDLPDDYVKVVSANASLSPIMDKFRPTYNNQRRTVNVDITLRYGLVKGVKTTDKALLETINGKISFTNFREIRPTIVKPITPDNMSRSDNCTNIINKLHRNDVKWLTLYAQSYLLIDNSQIDAEKNVVKSIRVLRNSVEKTVIEFVISNMNVNVVRDGERDVVIQDARVQLEIVGYKPDWTPESISTIATIYDYLPGALNPGWVTSAKLENYSDFKDKMSTTHIILISTFVVFAFITVLGLLYIIYSARNKRLSDRLYVSN